MVKAVKNREKIYKSLTEAMKFKKMVKYNEEKSGIKMETSKEMQE